MSVASSPGLHSPTSVRDLYTFSLTLLFLLWMGYRNTRLFKSSELEYLHAVCRYSSLNWYFLPEITLRARRIMLFCEPRPTCLSRLSGSGRTPKRFGKVRAGSGSSEVLLMFSVTMVCVTSWLSYVRRVSSGIVMGSRAVACTFREDNFNQ